MPEEESIGHIIETYQRIEITEHNIYKRLARSVKDPENSKILEQIADDELRHSADWEKYSQRKIKPNMWQVWKYYLISRIFGFTFGIKLMERGEENAQENYGRTDACSAKRQADRALRADHWHRCLALDGCFRVSLHPLRKD
jgi:hypothetical protein